MNKVYERQEKALSYNASIKEIAAGHRAFMLQMEENEQWLCDELEKLRKM